MNKVKTTVGRILFSSLLFFLGCTSFLFAIESEQLALMVSSIKESSTSMLIEKSIFLGLPSRNDREELINNLYSFYGFTPSIEEKIEEDFISINQADYFYIHKDKNIIFLDGNVSITIDSNSLQSNSILYDSSSGYLYAIGAVTLEQQKGEEQEIVIGNTLTYNRDNGQIMMNKGITKTSSSDEDGNITTFTSKGEEILLSNDPLSVLVKGSSVTTSEKSEYYQIKSKYFHVNDGNDLFLTHSFLYMGRVPILYLPFFFYPGKTIMFNPAFGYDSIKGPYINTSYELYGKNPLIHEDENSSITSLLGMNKNLEKSSSFIYSSLPQEPLSKVEKWAKESDSYGTIFVDAYKNNGLFIGYEGVHHLLNKTLDASLLGGVAYKNPTDLTNGSLIRFFITPNVSYKKNKTQLNLSLPFYSDPDVKKEYLDRDIRTELLELASINTKEENTLSTINSFT
ncbi:MAG: LPS-assembly protein LptD, partial [Spirochaetia bacterium]|nr:LPS-assembly protein LptD [Spirochaetia bacterium]